MCDKFETRVLQSIGSSIRAILTTDRAFSNYKLSDERFTMFIYSNIFIDSAEGR